LHFLSTNIFATSILGASSDQVIPVKPTKIAAIKINDIKYFIENPLKKIIKNNDLY
jgi:hypothetical protein